MFYQDILLFVVMCECMWIICSAECSGSCPLGCQPALQFVRAAVHVSATSIPFHSNLYAAHISPCFVGFRALFTLFMTPHVQSTSSRNCHSPNWRQELGDDHLSTSPRIFSLPLGIGPNDRGPSFEVVIQATMYLPVPGFEPGSTAYKVSVLPTELQWQNSLFTAFR